MAIDINYNYIVALAFLIIYLSCLGNCDNDGELLGASYIFGDSLVDAGNNNYLPTLSKANIKPNGIDFKASGGNPTGRYTNGRTIGDIVGKLDLFFSLTQILKIFSITLFHLFVFFPRYN